MSANDKQVAGTHYKTQYQHWDMLVTLGFGPEYYIGQATKYFTRWRKKNGLRDLKKGQHFLEKLHELVKQHGKEFLPYQGTDEKVETALVKNREHLEQYMHVNEVDERTKLLILGVLFSNSEQMLQDCIVECDDIVKVEALKGPGADAETPVSRDFEFHGYEDDHIKWRCKKCGENLRLQLTEPPVLVHKNCVEVASA